MGELPSSQQTSAGTNGMPSTAPASRRDVFISHSTEDASVARAVCKALENAGIGCWIAPRDIVPGQTWARAIDDGIGSCRVLVVVFSLRANESQEVVREVERASRHRKRLLAFRIDNVEPTGDLGYFLSSTHWLDAFPPPLEPRLAQLVQAASSHLGSETPSPEAPRPEPEFEDVDLDDFGRSRRRSGLLGRLFEDRG